jgi:hypothetical protein
MRFVETSVFTTQIVDALDDDSYRQLQVALLLRPEQGAVIRGSGGLRKIRWSIPGQGKRGGIRVIYFWHAGDETFFMLFAYSKNVQGDLTPTQVRTLKRFVEQEFK